MTDYCEVQYLIKFELKDSRIASIIQLKYQRSMVNILDGVVLNRNFIGSSGNSELLIEKQIHNLKKLSD